MSREPRASTLRPLLLIWLALSALACAKDEQARTELMLVADTDISDLDSIRFVVEGDDRQESEEGALRGDGAPLTLGVVLDKGSAGPLTVSALGIRNGRTVIERTAYVSFVEGKTLVVELHLVTSCELKFCLPERTCTERGCEQSQLDEAQLDEWSGTSPELGSSQPDAGDAGVANDAAVSPPGLVTCGADQQVDLSSDPAHCGACQNACKVGGRNTVAACVAGACSVECRPLYGDCDSNESNGCEQSLALSSSCGTCGVMCGAGSACSMGVCR